MTQEFEQSCCPDGSCAPENSSGPSRRRFLTLSAGAAGLTLLPAQRAIADALGVRAEDTIIVPEDKAIPQEWLDTLYERGEPTSYTGDDLRYIGMPVGGVCCGQVYLGGDGRLWHWDIFNEYAPTSWVGTAYREPIEPSSPFGQGFALRVHGPGGTRERRLDSRGFENVTFTGQYPLGRVEYAESGEPVTATLEAFSPFIPLSVEDSSLPAVVLEYTVRNDGSRPLDVDFLGWSENPVCLRSRKQQPLMLRSTAFSFPPHIDGFEFSADQQKVEKPETDIVFEDWETDSYREWTVEGTAFGSGPVALSEVPDYMLRQGSLGATGSRFVTSHNFRASDGTGPADAHTGKLTSPSFTIERDYLTTRIGGGNHPGRTCLNLLVDGEIVATATGRDSETMTRCTFDVSSRRGETAVIEIVDDHTGGWGHINVDDIVFTDSPDIVVEDWETDSYREWTVEGTAFGSGPVALSQVPDYMLRQGSLGATGSRFVTSHNFRASNGAVAADAHTGKLTSPSFTIERDYLTTRIGGGNHPDRTCLNLLIDGKIVASGTGTSSEPMRRFVANVSPWRGKTATIEIVDAHTGGWGHINVDDIVLTDRPVRHPLAEQPDAGTFAMATLHNRAQVRPSVAAWEGTDDLFGAKPAPEAVPARRDQAGTIETPLHLAPGQSETVRFIVSWYFPLPDRHAMAFLTDYPELRRHYAPRFDSAQDVVRYVADNMDRLEQGTRRWVDTWYNDSTLPHWFLERTFATASTLATSVCHRFDNGRFYGWEGVGCCAGTCQHVWNYAQSVARLFPVLERDTRERVDLDIALHEKTGEMGFRGEANMGWAADGQCGTILRCYREHLMSADDSFLQRNWAPLKQAIAWVIGHDAKRDGTLNGLQHNTLDANWYGEISWLSSLYVAALRAGAEMADVVGDRRFADRCRRLAYSGTRALTSRMWNDEHGYFIQKLDPDHLDAINYNHGCHVDQIFGQSYAWQVGLPRILPADKSRTALENLYRYNFAPDPARYRQVSEEIPNARRFAGAGEHGMIMTTWPFGGADKASGAANNFAVGYFDETWTGQEYQVASHMVAEGMVDKGLLLTRAVHERYRAGLRNPYNEIECGQHYVRGMSSYGVFLTLCGFEHDGPGGHIGFSPRMSAGDFAAAFTSAQGWGLYRQRRAGGAQTSEIEVRHGQLRIASVALPAEGNPSSIDVRRRHGPRVRVAETHHEDGRVHVTFDEPFTLGVDETLEVTI